MKRAVLIVAILTLASSAEARKSEIVPFLRAFSAAFSATIHYAMDPVLLYSNCWAESGNDRFAKGALGELGICQIMPHTWRALNCWGKPSDIWASYECAAKGLLEGLYFCGEETWKAVWYYRSGRCPRSKFKHTNGHIKKIEREMKRLRQWHLGRGRRRR